MSRISNYGGEIASLTVGLSRAIRPSCAVNEKTCPTHSFAVPASPTNEAKRLGVVGSGASEGEMAIVVRPAPKRVAPITAERTGCWACALTKSPKRFIVFSLIILFVLSFKIFRIIN